MPTFLFELRRYALIVNKTDRCVWNF